MDKNNVEKNSKSKNDVSNIHSGHRQRVKQRYIENGLDGFSAHEVLELLLFYGIPMKDTNAVAHALIDDFGSFQAVFDASAEDLAAVPGITENTAILIKLVKEVYAYYLKEKNRKVQAFKTISQVGMYMRPYFTAATVEKVSVLCLNAKNEPISCKCLFQGSINTSVMPLREIVAYVLKQNASGVVVAHNHPSGNALPSRKDIVTTQTLQRLLEAVDVHLVDHLIFSDDDFVSLVASGILNKAPSNIAFKQGDMRDFDESLPYNDPWDD